MSAFQEQLNSILGFLAKAETVDNRVLIELEKFYQTSSLLMGLSALNPDAPTAPLGGPMTTSTLTKSDQVKSLRTNHYLVENKRSWDKLNSTSF